MARALRPRATDALVVAPLAITDRTCHAVAGLDERPFRKLVVDLGIPHVMHGKRMVVLVEDFVEGLRRAGMSAEAPSSVHAPKPAASAADEEPASVDQLLARLGRRRAA